MTDALSADFDALRAEARSNAAPSDVLLMRPAPGDWAAGVVLGWDEREAPFGVVEVLRLAGVRTNEGQHPQDAVRRLDLDAAVLKRELGTAAEKDAPQVGSLVYVEALGERVSGKGTRYRAFTVRKSDPNPASLAVVAAARAAVQDAAPAAPASGGGGGAAAVGDEDIPFAASAV